MLGQLQDGKLVRNPEKGKIYQLDTMKLTVEEVRTIVWRFHRVNFFSIGFSSGEYGGKNIIFLLHLSTISAKSFLLWKLALSITMTSSSLTAGHSSFSNLKLKNVLSVVHLYSRGAKISFPRLEAMMFSLSNILPCIFT